MESLKRVATRLHTPKHPPTIWYLPMRISTLLYLPGNYIKLRRLYPTEHNALQIGNHPINAVSHPNELLTFISSSSAEPADICSHGAARGARPVVTGEQRAAAAVRWWCPPARRALSQEGQSSTYSVTKQNEGFDLHLVPLVAVRNTLPSEEAGSAAALLSDV